MRQSTIGIWLPEKLEDAQELAQTHDLAWRFCRACGVALHAAEAASTPEGWAQTQLSGLCQACHKED